MTSAAEDGVILAHLLSKRNLLDRRWFNGALPFLSILCTEGCKKGSDTDPCGTKVVYLVNLQTGVNLAAAIQNFVNLIGGDASSPQPKSSAGSDPDHHGFFKVCYDTVWSGTSTGH